MITKSFFVFLSLFVFACGSDPVSPQDMGPDEDMSQDVEDMPEDRTWQVVVDDWTAGLLAVSGTAPDDVWTVGARTHGKPAAFHYDGAQWSALDVPYDIDLWWVHATEEDVFFSGSDAAVLRYHNGELTRFHTPGLARHTVFGVWGTHDNLYAVGGIGNRNGFVWHFDGTDWSSLPMPKDTPLLPSGAMAGLFKVWGDGQGTVWFVGAAGLVLKREGDGPLVRIPVPTNEILFTVHGHSQDVFAVGGSGRGVLLRLSPTVEDLSPNSKLLQGLSVSENEVFASGAEGAIWHRDSAWKDLSSGPQTDVESYHAVWHDAEGGVWAVGGNVLSPSLDRGVLSYSGPRQHVFNLVPPAPEQSDDTCPADIVNRGKHRSVARRWIEQNLAAIRLEVPQPGVHARNLYHLSATMFDAWASFEPSQNGLVNESLNANLEITERDQVLSHAAFRLLSHRYGNGRKGARHTSCFRAVMRDLGLNPDMNSLEGENAAALGNRIGQAVIDHFQNDGALESQNYSDPSYVPPSPPLFVDEPGTRASDPTKWQPLNLARAVTQNGIALESGPTAYIGPHWGNVTPFSVARNMPDEPYMDPRPFPAMGPEMRDWVTDAIARTSLLATSEDTLDISPGSYGNQPLGSDESPGHTVNPFTGEPYPAQIVPRRDFARVLAEYWADGPNSETPPGHWNTIAHTAVDHAEFENRLFGLHDVDALTYDVHLYLVLNGALHDAAIVAWELKRLYETSRPITLIRWMGARGQSSDANLPSYHVNGLPLVPGHIELVTEESSKPGERHEFLAPFVGQVVIRSWPGAPGFSDKVTSQAAWIRAVEWSPYQPETFVSPAFPGYVSGHSTFSRAAAEVLVQITGSAFFPGGLGEFVAPQNAYLHFEEGPSQEVRLQWATYYDAANQSGQSRIFGGIHILPDDMDGRHFGASVGLSALDWARNNLAIVQ